MSPWSRFENDTCNPCGIKKKTPPGASRLGNSWTAILSCGAVAGLMPLAGFGMVAEIAVLIAVKCVVCYNAGVLRRFVDNVAQKRPTELAERMSLSVHYVLDRFSISEHIPRLVGVVCFVPVIRSMNVQTDDVFLLCLVSLWNDFVASNPAATSTLHTTRGQSLMEVVVLKDDVRKDGRIGVSSTSSPS